MINYPLLILKVGITLLLTLASVIFSLIKRNLRFIIYIIIIGNFASLFFCGATIVKGVVILDFQRTIAHVLPFLAFIIANFIFFSARLIIKRIKVKIA
jgi:hypothetical protein